MAKPRSPLSHPSDHDIALTLYQAFRRSNDVMFYCDRDGRIVDVNEAFTRHYGWTPEEVYGQNPRLIRSRHTPPETYKVMWSRILDPEHGFWRGELVNRTKDGRDVPVVLTITAVRDEAGDIVGYVSNAMDVGELRRLQERVAQSEAMAQVGQMAAALAHEIRNPLGSIVLAARQFSQETLSDQDRSLVLRILNDESRRLNETLTNFLTYARPREIHLVVSDLNALTSDVVGIVSQGEKSRLKFETKLDKSVRPFQFDGDQIRQVAWNIALNAVQAIEGKGHIKVSTGRRGNFVFVRFQDDGPGMPPEVQAVLFQPFKTSKSKGTGLGLAIADRIVRAHGGRIEAENGAQGGAVFTILLPNTSETEKQ